jgi:hypothetical protein
LGIFDDFLGILPIFYGICRLLKNHAISVRSKVSQILQKYAFFTKENVFGGRILHKIMQFGSFKSFKKRNSPKYFSLLKNTLFSKENFLISSILSNVMVFWKEKFSTILKKTLQKMLFAQKTMSLEVQFYTKSCKFANIFFQNNLSTN